MMLISVNIIMFEKKIKKTVHRAITSKSASRVKSNQQQIIEQVHTDTTGIKTIKSKSQCLPNDKNLTTKIDVIKIAKHTLTRKTPSNGKKSNQSSADKQGFKKSQKPVIYDNVITERPVEMKWSKNSISRKKQMKSVEKRKQWDASRIPYSCESVLVDFGYLLSKYEQAEIKEFKKVYYIGQNANIQLRLEHQEMGFDNDEKQYNFIEKDHIGYRFQILGVIGKGSYGQVFRVFDHKKKQEAALKMIKNKSKFTKQAFVEIQILTYIKEHDVENSSNIIKIRDFVIFRKHVCMVFEMMSENLYELIVRNNYNGLNMDVIRRFAIQLLVSLEFMRRHNIIHCDLKPENILLKEYHKSGLQIIDFGSSCFENETIYTYIQSRYYRAPQITLGLPYNTKIDTWSLGCILGELYCGVPLFPGENQNQQMKYFVDTLGFPSSKLLQDGTRTSIFFSKGDLKKEIKEQKNIEFFSKKLSERIPDTNFRQFLQLFLKWNATDRISPLQALKHEWIREGMPANLLSSDVFFHDKPSKSLRISKSKSKEKQQKKEPKKQIM